MNPPPSITYSDAKARIVRAIAKVTSFVAAAGEYTADRNSAAKRAKISKMLSDLNNIRNTIEEDVQVMEKAVNQSLAPTEITNTKECHILSADFDNLYYELAAFADVYHFSLSHGMDTLSAQSVNNHSLGSNNLSNYQLPKRKFPTFSGAITEWQGFEDLFKSILSHAPDLPDVERFEYLKTSLEGEALSLVAHLPLTSLNYSKAWDVLRARYGNKRDLPRIHLDALLAPHSVKSDDASSIKKLHTSILEHTAALDNLDFVTRQWSPILVHIFENHLDYDLRARWEIIVGNRHQPSISDFIEFLSSHVRSAEARSGHYTTTAKLTALQQKYPPKSSFVKSRSTMGHKVMTTATTSFTELGHQSSTPSSCPLCKKPHSIRKCQLFLSNGPSERFQIAKTHRLCINCLGFGHTSASCGSKFKCQSCNRSHNTLLHFEPNSTLTKPSTSLVVQSGDPQSSTSLIVRGQPHKVVLLSTVLLEMCATDGRRHSFRALLDSGSQASFITEKSANILMLNRIRSQINVTTFANSTASPVCGRSTVTVLPCGKQTPSFCLDTLIVPHITGKTPQVPVTPKHWKHIQDLKLADPTYYLPGSIDVLLGADIIPSLVLNGQRSGRTGEPMAMETVFGWVLLGPTTENQVSLQSCNVSVLETLDNTLKQFWEHEELPNVRHVSPDDMMAEDIYNTTTTRLSSGRFMVALPFKNPFPLLGDSKRSALLQFKSLETRLTRHDELRNLYHDFMRDYLNAGHMELVPPSERDTPLNYYIPHHSILKHSNGSTKLRVVFNASARTSVGLSLNESMYTGPKLQPSIQIVLLRSRIWKYVFVADIRQMYRQILVRPADRNYLRIFWRFSTDSPIEEYRLCTVTYGTSAAPFQAIRTLQELANTDGKSYPIAAAVLLNDTYVDDIFTGANSEEEALMCQTELIKLCAAGQLELRKWASNNKLILNNVPEDYRAVSSSIMLDDNEQSELKVLGLKWDLSTDTFSFKTCSSNTHSTKRSVLSDIARIFDLLGLLSPVTFWTKHFMQLLWTAGLDWDSPIPAHLDDLWKRHQTELKFIETISIPRRITQDCATSTQLHAFLDSSEKGYAAAVYLRIETPTSVHCQLITGKSKVAPLKRSTIPRLELCGALLAAKLLRFVVDAFQERLKIDQSYAWTDSTTALVWIRSSPHRWATFIANRTSQIHELTSPSIWNHVPTQFNPVDCASRGLFPSEIINHPLWWTGPPFLLEPVENWPQLPELQSQNIDTLPHFEPRKTAVLLVQLGSSIMDLLERFSSLNKILRILSYCFRLCTPRSTTPPSTSVTAKELSHSLNALIYCTQQISFSKDIARLKKGLSCEKELRRLDPFLDPAGLIRVGGRLTNSDLPYGQKHPLLLPSSHRLTTLIINHHHLRLKHPGAYVLQTHLQQHYWIQSARRIIRSRIRLCIPCFRTRPKSVVPKMAPLPKFRVQQIKPFSISGVDYAGPITIKRSRGRSSTSTSAYICLFVCMATKAIHLELSSDLSTETFLLAFTRFASRRGPISEMHSDCGTNFVGASRLLTPVESLIQSTTFQDRVHNQAATTHITWHFNPPPSPHFGGLWEARVKSTKALIFRSLGTHKLNSEELSTLLTQIEATLNSRPLSALSNDPSDLSALTPSHFLTLEPSTNLPDPHLDTIPMSKLLRWRLITDLHRHFWMRWKNEYLSSLQLRNKWTENRNQLNLGDLVLIKEATHPLNWRMGRVIKLHPGGDGNLRVVTVRTTSGVLVRPAVKLCPLPSC